MKKRFFFVPALLFCVPEFVFGMSRADFYASDIYKSKAIDFPALNSLAKGSNPAFNSAVDDFCTDGDGDGNKINAINKITSILTRSKSTVTPVAKAFIEALNEYANSKDELLASDDVKRAFDASINKNETSLETFVKNIGASDASVKKTIVKLEEVIVINKEIVDNINLDTIATVVEAENAEKKLDNSIEEGKNAELIHNKKKAIVAKKKGIVGDNVNTLTIGDTTAVDILLKKEAELTLALSVAKETKDKVTEKKSLLARNEFVSNSLKPAVTELYELIRDDADGTRGILSVTFCVEGNPRHVKFGNKDEVMAGINLLKNIISAANKLKPLIDKAKKTKNDTYGIGDTVDNMRVIDDAEIRFNDATKKDGTIEWLLKECSAATYVSIFRGFCNFPKEFDEGSKYSNVGAMTSKIAAEKLEELVADAALYFGLAESWPEVVSEYFGDVDAEATLADNAFKARYEVIREIAQEEFEKLCANCSKNVIKFAYEAGAKAIEDLIPEEDAENSVGKTDLKENISKLEELLDKALCKLGINTNELKEDGGVVAKKFVWTNAANKDT